MLTPRRRNGRTGKSLPSNLSREDAARVVEEEEVATVEVGVARWPRQVAEGGQLPVQVQTTAGEGGSDLGAAEMSLCWVDGAS